MKKTWLIPMSFLTLLSPSCSEKRDRSQSGPAPVQTPTPPSQSTAPTDVPAANEPSATGSSVQGPAFEKIDIPLDKVRNTRVRFSAFFIMKNFDLGPLGISAKFHPEIKVLCGEEVKDMSSAVVLSPAKELRLVAQADVSSCPSLGLEIPKKPQGFTFDSEASKLTWFLDVTGNDGVTLRYESQVETAQRVEAEYWTPVIISDKVPPPARTDEDVSRGVRFELMVIRELGDYQLSGLQISEKFWPKMNITCDDKIVDETTAFNQTKSTLRLAVRADITDCRTIRVGPPYGQSEGTYNDQKSSVWYSFVRKVPL